MGTLSHELRTPLSSILLCDSNAAPNASADPEQVTRLLAYIERNTEGRVTKSNVRICSTCTSEIMSVKLRLDVQQLNEISPATIRSALETLTPAIEAKELQLQTSLNPSCRNHFRGFVALAAGDLELG